MKRILDFKYVMAALTSATVAGCVVEYLSAVPDYKGFINGMITILLGFIAIFFILGRTVKEEPKE